MKKLFMGTVALITFSLSIMVFNVACSKELKAGTVTTILQPRVLIQKQSASSNGYDIFSINEDLSSSSIDTVATGAIRAKLSADHQSVFVYFGGLPGSIKKYNYNSNTNKWEPSNVSPLPGYELP